MILFYFTVFTLPFKFIYYKDDQAYQCRWHEHDDRRAAETTVAAVHKRSFTGGKVNEKMSLHGNQNEQARVLYN